MSVAGFLVGELREPVNHRDWALAANDGIIATAALLLGFAGAGAGDRLLLFTATAAAIAGGLTAGGAKWAETSAEREAQLQIARAEAEALRADPAGELEELVCHWQTEGLSPELARRVAEELTRSDALGAQLDWEYDFDEPMARGQPLWTGVSTGAAFVVGALVPLLITYFAPVDVEVWAVLVAALTALALTSVVAARTARLRVRGMMLRAMAVGATTLVVSYLAGELLL